MSSLKNEISASEFETEAQDLQYQAKLRLVNIIHSLRLALTVSALAAGIIILGVSADSLATYRKTYLPADFFLPLWPEQFDLRPTTALVAGSVIVVLANAMSLLASKTHALRSRTVPHAGISLAAPVAGFIASVVAMALFYAINSSTTVDTFQSWTCRWSNVPMKVQPHFGTLCMESQAGVVLSVFLVPLEALILGIAGYQAMLERHTKPASSHHGDA